MTSEADAPADVPELPWIVAGEPLPDTDTAWGPRSLAPGLLAASNDLSAQRLVSAYQNGIFPWFSAGQPVLWWSPDPRMVLKTAEFRFRKSLHNRLKSYASAPGFELCFDRKFGQVIRHCATVPRNGQKGTWIVPEMVAAYENLHRLGVAHSCEVWLKGELVAGLYFVALGQAVFGESMFTTVTDGSKMALACLVSVCRQHGIEAIDCQQNTRHLASLGAREVSRRSFVRSVHLASAKAGVDWAGQALHWPGLLSLDTSA